MNLIDFLMIILVIAVALIRNEYTFNKQIEASGKVYRYKMKLIKDGDFETLTKYSEMYDEAIIGYWAYLFNIFYFGSAIRKEYRELLNETK